MTEVRACGHAVPPTAVVCPVRGAVAGAASASTGTGARRRQRPVGPILVVLAAVVAGAIAFRVMRSDNNGGSAPPSDATAARERLVDGDAVCRPPREVPDDVFGGKVDAPDQMVECTLDGESVRILAWDTTARREQAMADMAIVVCKLDDDADAAIVTGPLMIQTFGGDPASESERQALTHTAALLHATVTDNLCAHG